MEGIIGNNGLCVKDPPPVLYSKYQGFNLK